MATTSEGDLFSSNWFRVADLKVTLHQHTSIIRHTYRGEVWHVLQNHVSGQSYRFNESVYHLITLMNGTRSLQDVWHVYFNEMNQDMPTQDDIIKVVLSLYHADILRLNDSPDIDNVFERHQKDKRQKILQYIKSPMGIKISLFDPEKFLNATHAWVAPLFNPVMAIIWLIFVTYGVFLANLHWSELVENSSDRIFSSENILIMILIYPVVKIIHELGHAYSVKRWGGEVHEIGVMFLVFYPVPYVDATAAIAFPSKYKRMLVGAAGILVELFIAAIAMHLWALSEEGLFRAVMYNIMLITGVSTLLFNGNPLLKFDAYFVLADALEIPNLGQKSNQYLGYLFQNKVLGLRQVAAPPTTKGEAKWLLSYALASYLYRLFLMVAIVVFVATKYLFLGVLMGLWSIYQGFFQPIIKGGLSMWKNVLFARKKIRLYGTFSSIAIGLFLLFFIIPFPYSSNTQGVVSAPEHSNIRVPETGFIQDSAIVNGELFAAGDILITIDPHEINLKIRLLELQLLEINDRTKAGFKDRASIAVLHEEYRFLEEQLRLLQKQKRQFTLIANKSGTLITQRDNIESQYLRRGDILGQIIAPQDILEVIALVPIENIDYIRHHLDRVELRFAVDSSIRYQQQITLISPSSLTHLPSAILSIKGGGDIASKTSSKGEILSFTPYYHLKIDLPEDRQHYLNERVYVVFRYHSEALYGRIYRNTLRFFMRYFDA